MTSDRERVEELRRFLKERRARLRPADVGLPATARRRVPGLRREEVAMLAGIGISWYTALENGDARGASEATLLAVAEALRLSTSERDYLMALAAPFEAQAPATPGPLTIATLHALLFPAYIITASWIVLDCNAAFRRVWGVRESEPPFNAIERLFLAPPARAMHGSRFAENIRPVLAMLQSSIGRYPNAADLRRLRDRLLVDETLRAMWSEYEISGPLLSNAATIESPIGTFSYETLTLPVSDALHGIVVQVPDRESRARLIR